MPTITNVVGAVSLSAIPQLSKKGGGGGVGMERGSLSVTEFVQAGGGGGAGREKGWKGGGG